jgi:TrmH family RNA methyltransferase
MGNFGFDDLWIVNPKIPVGGEARAYAMHGLNVLQAAKTVVTLDQALETVDLVIGTSAVVASSRSNLLRIPITPKEMAKRVRSVKRRRVALLFGRESSGLTNHEMGVCDLLVTIPASRSYNVLNLASSASIILYELFQATAAKNIELASGGTKQRLLTQFDHLATLSETPLHKRRLAQRSFRNIISRSFITRREASLLIGVFRRSLVKATQT